METRAGKRKAIVVHPRYEEAYQRIRECHASRCDEDELDHLKLLGVSGTGKTTLLRDYAAQHPPQEAVDRTLIPVVYAKMPTAPTPVRLAGRLLRAMGAIGWNKGNEEERTYQLTTLAANCCVEIFLIDEVQHAVDRGRAKSHSKVADWLKDFEEEVRRPIVLTGLPRIQLLDSSNGQFARRFCGEYFLDRFSTSPHDQTLVQSLIESYCDEVEISLNVTPDLQEFALRLTYASNGSYGYKWKLFKRVARSAKAEGRKAVSMSDFLAAFAKYIWVQAPPHRQPFHPDFDWVELSQPGEPFAPDAPEAGW